MTRDAFFIKMGYWTVKFFISYTNQLQLPLVESGKIWMEKNAPRELYRSVGVNDNYEIHIYEKRAIEDLYALIENSPMNFFPLSWFWR